jgi:hypothetical protein
MGRDCPPFSACERSCAKSESLVLSPVKGSSGSASRREGIAAGGGYRGGRGRGYEVGLDMARPETLEVLDSAQPWMSAPARPR